MDHPAAYIVKRRGAVGFTQGDLARAATATGIMRLSQPTLSRWESGALLPSLTGLAAIDRGLGLPLGTILRDAGWVDQEALSAFDAIEADERLSEANKAALRRVWEVMALLGPDH